MSRLAASSTIDSISRAAAASPLLLQPRSPANDMHHHLSASQVSSTAVLELSQPPCAEVPDEFNIFNENSNYSQCFS